MTQTDMAGVTCSDCAIVGRATFAMAASSTTSIMAASTDAIATVRLGSPSPDIASSVCPVDRISLRSSSRAGDVDPRVMEAGTLKAMNIGAKRRPMVWVKGMVTAPLGSRRRPAQHTSSLCVLLCPPSSNLAL